VAVGVGHAGRFEAEATLEGHGDFGLGILEFGFGIGRCCW
jgi:hypothetical protein